MVKSVTDLIAEASQHTSCVPANEAVERYLASEGGVLIDVREPTEVAVQALEGAIPIPRGTLEMQVGKHCADADVPIFVFCSAGGRAVLAAQTLQEMGYRNVTAIVSELSEIARELETRRAP